jgi:hypothetical protein
MATKRCKRTSDLDWTDELLTLLWAIMSDEAKEECIEDFRRVVNGPPRAVDYEDQLRRIFGESESAEPMPKAFYDADVIRGHALGVVIEPEIGPKLGRKAKRLR